MGKGKAPKPPNPTKVAQQQMKVNQATAGYEQAANMVNQVGPDGSLIYSQSGYRDIVDPFTGRITKVPSYTATTALSDAQHKIKGETDAAEFNMANAAKMLSGQIDSGPFKINEDVEKRLYDLGRSRVDPRMQQMREQAEVRAANQGLKLGSTAYDRLMRNVGEQENDAYNQLALTGNQQAWQQAMAEYNNPIDRISALLSGSQVNSPNAGFVNTPNSNVANTDYAGQVNSNYQGELAAWQQKQRNFNEMVGGLFGLAGKFIKPSDRRLKEDVRKIGKTTDGQNIYSYRYKGGKSMHLGLMAQEVERRKPDAVGRDGFGFRVVDYGMALEDA